MSEMRMAWSSARPSGSFTSEGPASGTRAYSAWRPLIGPVVLGPPKNAVPAVLPLGLALSHWEWYPEVQYEQWPQQMVEGTTTRSPGLISRTDVPTSSTTPTPSCPRMVPG